MSQNTVGTLISEKEELHYFLIYPNRQSTSFLLDACGRIINSWEDDSNSIPGTAAFINDDGNLIRAKASGDIDNYFGAGGAGGIIECLDWDGNLIWQHINSDSIYRQHHDFFEMPNGNVLYLTWKRRFFQEIVELGFDTLTNPMEELWFECVNEYNPDLDSIVWQWCSDNHLIQEFDSLKVNYGKVSDQPERVDINYQDDSFDRRDWIHSNSVAYNEELDQISISCRNFSEIWIIDHSTSTEEAKGSTGGVQGKGGDLLHRFGNPQAYKNGNANDRILFRPHDAKWILKEESPYHNQILVYNNHLPNNTSNAVIYNPFENGSYAIEEGKFLPISPTRYIAPIDTLKMYSTAGSNVQLLDNGNFFICAARQGRILELTNEEEIVWEYLVPFRNGFPIEQGTILNSSDNFNFKSIQYNKDHPALVGRDLSSTEYLELNPSIENCLISEVKNLIASPEIELESAVVYDNLLIKSTKDLFRVMILNSSGIKMKVFDVVKGLNEVDLSNYTTGVYFLLAPSEPYGSLRFFKIK